MSRQAIVIDLEVIAYAELYAYQCKPPDEIAQLLGFSKPTFFRKKRTNPDFRQAVDSGYKRGHRRTPYRKIDTEYWAEVDRRGSVNRKLRKAKQWKKFQLMIAKGDRYRQEIQYINNRLHDND